MYIASYTKAIFDAFRQKSVINGVQPLTEGFPWDDLRKILHGGQQMAMVQNGVETLQKI